MNGPVTQLVVTFDRQLFPNPTPNGANWIIRHTNQLRTVTAGNAVGFTLTLTLTPGGADVGPDVVSFDPPPFDILDLLTLEPVAAFADFPVT